MQAQEADHICIPLLNGEHTLAQVARIDDNAALIYITTRIMKRTSEVFPIGPKDVKATLLTRLDDIPPLHWDIIGYEPIADLRNPPPPSANDPDCEIYDPSVIEAFANALHGLYPWDGFPEPNFFTNMLRTPDKLPSRIKMKADLPHPT